MQRAPSGAWNLYNCWPVKTIQGKIILPVNVQADGGCKFIVDQYFVTKAKTPLLLIK